MKLQRHETVPPKFGRQIKATVKCEGGKRHCQMGKISEIFIPPSLPLESPGGHSAQNHRKMKKEEKWVYEKQDRGDATGQRGDPTGQRGTPMSEREPTDRTGTQRTERGRHRTEEERKRRSHRVSVLQAGQPLPPQAAPTWGAGSPPVHSCLVPDVLTVPFPRPAACISQVIIYPGPCPPTGP